MSQSVPRIGRLLDLLGFALFLAGAGLYGWAWLGMRQLQSAQPVSQEATQFAALARFNELSQLSNVGVGLMVVGAATAVLAMATARFLVARGSSPE